jgi:hypothetical protein
VTAERGPARRRARRPNFEEELAAIIGPYIDELVASLQAPWAPVLSGRLIALLRRRSSRRHWGRSRRRPGGSSAYLQQVFQALQQISSSLGVCREHAFDRCVQNHDLHAIAAIVAYTRVMQALGIDDSPSPLDEMIEKCARFRLLFEGGFCVDKTDEDCTGGIYYQFILDEELYISMTVTPGVGPLGAAPLLMTEGRWGPYGGCTGETESPGSDFQVISGGISMNLRQVVKPAGELPEITLVINPGIPPETLHLTCNFGNDTQYTTLWWQKWCSWHQPELTPPFADTAALCFYNDEPGGWDFAITDWEQNYNYPPLQSAIKEYDRNHTQVGAAEIGWEKSDLVLIHEPIH